AGICTCKSSGDRNIAEAGIGLGDVDDVSVLIDQLRRINSAGLVVHPATGNVDAGAVANDDGGAVRGRNELLELRGREPDAAAGGHQTLGADAYELIICLGIDERRANPSYAIVAYAGLARIEIDLAAVQETEAIERAVAQLVLLRRIDDDQVFRDRHQ